MTPARRTTAEERAKVADVVRAHDVRVGGDWYDQKCLDILAERDAFERALREIETTSDDDLAVRIARKALGDE